MRRNIARILYLTLLYLYAAAAASGAEPALPAGLGESSEEADSADPSQEEPALPSGLGGDDSPAEEVAEEEKGFELPFNFYGFVDTRFGTRIQNDPYQDDLILGENRLQLGADRRWSEFGFKLVADFIMDYTDSHEGHVDLERGEGWVDLRQANIIATPLAFMDIKVGRQILTWGTGDLLFINDNFPKDWRAFFSGRDTEYLKAPSDALKTSFFTDFANLDLVYTPRFDPDRYITGNRISYYNAALGRRSGQDAEVKANVPDDWFNNDEVAARLYHNLKGVELALYGYDGYWKSPGGQNRQGEALFPELSVWGASVRSPFAGGIGNLEFGWYDSSDDPDGDNPLINNSEARALIGYERDLDSVADELTLALQYYIECMQDYSAYERSLPDGAPKRDEYRHVLTVRLTKMLMRQNLELSLFSYYSPSDEDVYARPYAGYKIDDNWLVEAGANLFAGSEPHTFFGQFEKNNNIYATLRYSF